MKNKSTIHDMINLRSMVLNAETNNQVNNYGIGSATEKGKYFYNNISLTVLFILKPVMFNRFN